MKKYIALFIFALALAIPSMAQNKEGSRPHFDPEQFKTQMDNYIREKAGLTQEEADKLFPIFHEMKDKQKDILQKIHNLKKAAASNSAAASKAISQITALEVQQAKLEQTYYAKMCKVVDAKKVLEVMKAEDAFHRDMLRKAGPGGPKSGAPRKDGAPRNGGPRGGAPRGGQR